MQVELLLVEDDPDQGEMLAALLRRKGMLCTLLSSADQVFPILTEREPTAIIADVQLGLGMSGIDLCKRVRELAPGVPVIMITGAGALEVAIDAIRAGAYDFVVKPIATDAMLAAVHRAVERRALQDEVRRLRVEANAAKPIDGLLGESTAMRDVVAMIRRVANSDATVLVNGESGTGKEKVSRSVHDFSPRRDKPFVAINCAAVPAALLESELFGHTKGAFTDAKRDRPGLFVQAAGGTIFLDEIGEMPLEMQAKLLRVLQERKVRPVGGDEEIAFDARLVCATNRDLEAEVEAGRFREDLYYRVNVVAVRVPPLRDRSSDILLLATHFIAKIAERSGRTGLKLSPEAARRMLDYDWPGNVRELENCMERAVALSLTGEILIRDLPEKVQAYEPTKLVVGSGSDDLVTLAELERRYIRQVMAAVVGNKSQAARILGIDRRSLYRRLDGEGETIEA